MLISPQFHLSERHETLFFSPIWRAGYMVCAVLCTLISSRFSFLVTFTLFFLFYFRDAVLLLCERLSGSSGLGRRSVVFCSFSPILPPLPTFFLFTVLFGCGLLNAAAALTRKFVSEAAEFVFFPSEKRA